MTPVTAWELDAERRREQVLAWKTPRSTYIGERNPRPSVSIRRLVSSLLRMPAAGWEDLRT